MLSRKSWQADLVFLFCGVQLLCFCAGTLAGALLHKAGVHGFRGNESLGTVLVMTLSFQGATWILIPIFLRLHQVRWRDAFGVRGWNVVTTVLQAAAAMVLILPVALVLEGASQWILGKLGWPVESQVAVQLVADADTLWMKLYLAVFTIVLAPVAEEFIFRGVLYPCFKELGRPWLAWAGVSALFAFIHFDAATFLPLFWLALALTWLYEQTDCLLVPIAAHSLFNTLGFIVILFGDQLGHILRQFGQRLHF